MFVKTSIIQTWSDKYYNVGGRWQMKFALSNFKFKSDMSDSSSDHTVFRESFSLATSKLYIVSVWQKCIIHFLRPLNAGGDISKLSDWVLSLPRSQPTDSTSKGSIKFW